MGEHLMRCLVCSHVKLFMMRLLKADREGRPEYGRANHAEIHGAKKAHQHSPVEARRHVRDAS